VSRGQRGGSPTVVNLSFLEKYLGKESKIQIVYCKAHAMSDYLGPNFWVHLTW
jgi:hypothetical protein